MTYFNQIPDFNPSCTKAITLEADGGWPLQYHLFEQESVYAIQAALVTGRPLLVRGEPGTGKSQLARAAAVVLERPLLYEVITSRTEATDLLYNFDMVRRLGEAQIQAAITAGSKEMVRENLEPRKFLSPGKMWWALNWNEAEKQAGICNIKTPATPANWSTGGGCVLLIDEIDKADSDLPNALLECFANRSFQIPYLPEPVVRDPDQSTPLVIITTNEERELPAAFLRRCLVVHLKLPREKEKLIGYLQARAEAHFGQYKEGTVRFNDIITKAIECLLQDREKAETDASSIAKPGLAEFLDLLDTVFKITDFEETTVETVVERFARYTLQKNPETDW